MAPKILLVDDNATIVKIFSQILRDKGYDTCSAQSGQEGLEVFAKERPDMVFTDARMSPGDGMYLTKAIRENSKVPIAMLTGYVSPDLKERFLGAGGNDLLPKPFELGPMLELAESYAQR